MPATNAAEAGVPKGRPVAKVGDEVIALPELTRAVKERIGQLPAGQSPTRRQVIALAKATLKAMVVRSLVVQEAGAALGGPAKVAEELDRIGRRWDREELAALMRRERVANADDLRGKLASRPGSPEAAREEFLIRTLAAELMRREGRTGSVEDYLGVLQKRRPVTSIMNAAELFAAGRRAAGEDAVARTSAR